jgi:pSer/pThr/pTyr-binding forkhead associated (FHA) protein
MRLRYTKPDGGQMEFHLSDQPITIGRSPDADIVLLDEKVSRIHCGVRLWDGDYYLKDLKSKNGTFVNGERTEVAKLRSSDHFRVGSTAFVFEQEPEVGQDTALQEIKDEMELGKGYTTILREIVDDVDEKQEEVGAAPEGAQIARVPEEAPEPKKPSTTVLPKRKPLKVIIKRRA